MAELVFEEKQRFTQWWLWLVILGLNGLMIYGVVTQMFFGIPFGDHPMPSGGLLFTTMVMFAVTGFMFMIHLKTEITTDVIQARLFPFHIWKQVYKWEDIEKAYVRKYNALTEFGGWGLRFGWPGKGRAYNIKGNMGLQLQFKDGSRLLIGTSRPDVLAEAIRKINRYAE